MRKRLKYLRLRNEGINFRDKQKVKKLTKNLIRFLWILPVIPSFAVTPSSAHPVLKRENHHVSRSHPMRIFFAWLFGKLFSWKRKKKRAQGVKEFLFFRFIYKPMEESRTIKSKLIVKMWWNEEIFLILNWRWIKTKKSETRKERHKWKQA